MTPALPRAEPSGAALSAATGQPGAASGTRGGGGGRTGPGGSAALDNVSFYLWEINLYSSMK